MKAENILTTVAIGFALSLASLQNNKPSDAWLRGYYLGKRSFTLLLLRDHLNEAPRRVRLAVGKTIARILRQEAA